MHMPNQSVLPVGLHVWRMPSLAMIHVSSLLGLPLEIFAPAMMPKSAALLISGAVLNPAQHNCVSVACCTPHAHSKPPAESLGA